MELFYIETQSSHNQSQSPPIIPFNRHIQALDIHTQFSEDHIGCDITHCPLDNQWLLKKRQPKALDQHTVVCRQRSR